jgi:hypothetical protein
MSDTESFQEEDARIDNGAVDLADFRYSVAQIQCARPQTNGQRFPHTLQYFNPLDDKEYPSLRIIGTCEHLDGFGVDSNSKISLFECSSSGSSMIPL